MNIGRKCRPLMAAWIGMIGLWGQPEAGAADKARIQPFAENPRYWQYEGKPLLRPDHQSHKRFEKRHHSANHTLKHLT